MKWPKLSLGEHTDRKLEKLKAAHLFASQDCLTSLTNDRTRRTLANLDSATAEGKNLRPWHMHDVNKALRKSGTRAQETRLRRKKADLSWPFIDGALTTSFCEQKRTRMRFWLMRLPEKPPTPQWLAIGLYRALNWWSTSLQPSEYRISAAQKRKVCQVKASEFARFLEIHTHHDGKRSFTYHVQLSLRAIKAEFRWSYILSSIIISNDL